jgi:hypothetical protein
MQVRLKMAWGQWSKGHVFASMPGGQARTLIARGIAEKVVDEAKAMGAPINRMLRADKFRLKVAR